MDPMNRRAFLAGATTALGTQVLPLGAHRERPTPAQVSGARGASGGELAAPAYMPLPLGAIRPTGWLHRQLTIQAQGLTGHLDTFWPDVAQSQWFGGTAEGWERAPYWLDGAIPLAWLLDDRAMQARITGYVDHIVRHQRADGWYAPYPTDVSAQRYDMWAILLANKVLAQYHEATGDARVLEAVRKSLRAMATGLQTTPLYGWGRFRWYEGLVPIFHVHARTGEAWLLELAHLLRAQGVDFGALCATDDFAIPTPRRGLWKWTKHVVNLAMATKASALSWRLDQRPADRAFATTMIELLDRHHGQVTGMFTGDECLSGRNPLQGTELCAVVEFMYSLEQLYAVFGTPLFADRLERVAYNALPATLAPDGWSHQYDQQVNQVQCTINPDHGWSTNGPDSNLFGLEPNYGCCTANMHQGWPKFAAHLWMATPDEGLVSVAWAPARVEATVRGVPLTLDVQTDYPFREHVALKVTAARPVRAPLWLRVPAWADGATVRIGPGAPVRAEAGALHRVERDWTDSTDVTLTFPMRPLVSTRYNEAVAVERGPLVYALKIGEQWTRVNADKPHRELPHADFEVTPTTPWNYGLAVDPTRPDAGLRFEERPLGDQPFSPEGAGMAATARGRRIPGWKMVNGWAGELSPADVAWSDAAREVTTEPLEDVTLLPYGCTNLRITEFPRVKGGEG